MRKEFTAWCGTTFAKRPQSLFLTGDLGFMALEELASQMGPRFINAGVAEQNMVSVAAGFAQQGLEPICYSIAPFAVFRPCEQIRLDLCLHNLNVKIVGNGGGYGYGIMGASHHAIEDLAVLSSFPGLRCFIPVANEDVVGACDQMLAYRAPSYLRLGFGALPAGTRLPPFAPWRQLHRATDSRLTIVGLGPVLLNAWNAVLKTGSKADLFCVGEFPAPSMPEDFIASVSQTRQLVVVEEHTRRGGLAEQLSLQLLERSLAPKIQSLSAAGYPSGRYGSQGFHHRESGLDAESIATLISTLTTVQTSAPTSTSSGGV